MKVKIYRAIAQALLAILNSRFINKSPCLYGYINGLDAVSYEELAIEAERGTTVKELVESIDRFNTCPLSKNLQVIEHDGSIRDADIWDVHQLRQSLQQKEPKDAGK